MPLYTNAKVPNGLVLINYGSLAGSWIQFLNCGQCNWMERIILVVLIGFFFLNRGVVDWLIDWI